MSFKTPMRRRPARLLAPLLLALLAPAAARAQQAPEPPLITVTGQAEVQVAPDEVIFGLQVENTEKELNAARERTDERVRAILALARRFQIAPQDVKTDYISVEMKYSTDLLDDADGGDGERRVKREFIGYAVSKTVTMRSTDIPRFEELFSEVLRLGVSSVNRVEFRTTQMRRHKDQARALAIRAAREKALALTREIGQTIGKAHTIREEGDGRAAASSNYSTVVGGSFSADEGSAIAPGMIRVSAQVTVSFILN